MKLGIDASTQLEVDAKNPHYTYKGQKVEPWRFVYDHNGVRGMRLRLWIDPYDEEGRPYAGGTVDYPAFKTLAKRAMEIGYDIMLDFHYSDFWCDPGKQFIPKSWRGLSLEDTADTLYNYTKEILRKTKEDGLNITSVQIGNEITNGILWPLGKLTKRPDGRGRDGYDNLSLLLKAGLRALREELPSAKAIIHLENSGNAPLHEEFFREIISRGVEFDVIGESYYPYWHGTFDMLFANIENLKKTFHKPVWIVETGYGFALEPFIDGEGFKEKNLIDDEFFKQPNTYKPYPITKEGQKEFVKELLRLSKEHGVEAVYYWEPFWLPLPGLEWSSKIGQAYTHETEKPTGNEWSNQCLFDYEGVATPALDEFTSDD